MGLRSSWEVNSFFLLQQSNNFLPCDNSLLCITTIGLYSEGSIPIDIADRLGASFPSHVSIGMGQRSAAKIAELDK